MEINMRALVILLVVILLIGLAIIGFVRVRQDKQAALARLEAHFQSPSKDETVKPKVALVFHNNPLGGWWLGLKKLDDGTGFWQLAPQSFTIYDENDQAIIRGEYTFDFRFEPKGTTRVLARGVMRGVRTASAYTGFGDQELWAELDDWAPAERMP